MTEAVTVFVWPETPSKNVVLPEASRRICSTPPEARLTPPATPANIPEVGTVVLVGMKAVAVMFPEETTLVGVMSPRVTVTVGAPTVPPYVALTPLAVTTVTEVRAVIYVEAPVKKVVALAVPEPNRAGATVPVAMLPAVRLVSAEPSPAKEVPVNTVPLKVVPDTAPDEATDTGVMAPKVMVIAGVPVAVTDPDTPLAVTMVTAVTAVT